MVKLIFNSLRNKSFWMLDKFTGSLIKNAYDEITTINELDYDHAIVLKHQNNQLKKLLSHTLATTKYYKELKEINSLEDFPIINKIDIKDDPTAFMSHNYDTKDLFLMSTSGSTGTPFVCYQNKEKKKRVHAEVIYYSEKLGYKVGKNLVFLRAINGKSKKSTFKQLIQNETLIDISKLDDKKIQSILEKISKVSNNGSMVLAYASTYDAFKNYFMRNGNKLDKKINVTGIVSSSEMLFDETRNAMKEIFNCQVISRYSNQENGIIAQDEYENNIFILNNTNYIIEIFDFERDEKLPEGEIGRIVITDLYNLAMPMIRYDTGDIGSITKVNYKGKVKKAISNFGGRKIDIIYDSFGNRLSPHAITNSFWLFPEINQFQLIQKDKNVYTIKINVEKDFNKIAEVGASLKRILGSNANIKIKLVDEIPELSSGKRKYVVSEL